MTYSVVVTPWAERRSRGGPQPPFHAIDEVADARACAEAGSGGGAGAAASCRDLSCRGAPARASRAMSKRLTIIGKSLAGVGRRSSRASARRDIDGGSWRKRIAGTQTAILVVAGLAGAPAAQATISTDTRARPRTRNWIADSRHRGTGRCCFTVTASVRWWPPTPPTRRPGRRCSTADTRSSAPRTIRPARGGRWVARCATSSKRSMRSAPLPSKPREVIAFGTSMGGLISALESESGHGRIDGALRPAASWPVPSTSATISWTASTRWPSCLRRRSRSSSCASPMRTKAWRPASSSMRSRSRRRARRKVVRVSRWRWLPQRADLGAGPGDACPRRLRRPRAAAVRHPVQRRVHHDGLHRVGPAVDRAGRGGNPSWTVGVDFARQLARSPYAPQVRALYRQAGLDLRWTSER